MNEASANSAPEPTQENCAQDEDLEASLVQLASKLFPKDEVQKNMRFMEDMEARVSEMEARLAMAEEAKSVAIKERDAADEARKKLEKTLAELISKFAGVRESHAALLRDAEQARAGYDAHKMQFQESERKIRELSDSDAALRQQNDELRQQNEELREKMESQFLNLEVLQTQLRGEQREREAFSAEIVRLKAHAHGEIKPALSENDRFSREMVTHVEDIVEQLRALRDDVAQRCAQMENVSNYLGNQITETHDKLARRLNTQQEQAEPDDLPPARPIDSTPMLQAQPA